ncbi:MAG TPA: 2,3-bisphosphoglycerate-independent phosphoglycerate mutase [Bdellovibrionota bacterium]|nr:2,3-bisphosphoglycerate-independent phosphoglycerate mutase [Bdellovibrionota bacterium]
MKKDPKIILIVIDGWGIRRETKANAIAQALTPNYSRYLGQYPNGQLTASGLAVGLPEGIMGNSEVGHMNIGSGRRVVQDQVRIHDAIDSGEFFKNAVLKKAMAVAREGEGALHLLGLVSQGNVHSAERHYLSLIEMARKEKVPGDRIFAHAILDGRDTPPKSAQPFLKTLEESVTKSGGKIATVSGRFYTMDRDKRWERIDLGYKALVHGEGHRARNPQAALSEAYERGETDEFVLPTVVADAQGKAVGRISSGDSVVCFNFRPDRMRQIVRALTNNDAPVPSLKKDLKVSVTTFTQYDRTFDYPVVFLPQDLTMVAGEVFSKNGLRQFRTAETEKYAHVTYFFNGGREDPFPLEDRRMIPSPKVRTYDLQPEMSSTAVKETMVERTKSEDYSFLVANFANPDMVGHTGNFDAAVAAVEATDRCLGEIVDVGLQKEYDIFITADHGNVEMMQDPLTGAPHTAHTTNPVPLICIGQETKKYRIHPNGALCDVIPTILSVARLEQPPQMTGKSLLYRS